MKTMQMWMVVILLFAGAVAGMGANEVWVLRIDGEVGAGTVTYLRNGLSQAEAAGATQIVLVLSTPGGILNAGVVAKDLLLDANIPTIAYINRQALSAGALLAIACDQIIFAPGGVLGAATPLVVVNDTLREAPEKTISAVRKIFRATAEFRGRVPEVAEAMVDRAVVIPGLVEQWKLLTLTASEAEPLGYSDGTANTLEELLAGTHMETAIVIEYSPQWVDIFVEKLTIPLVAGVLIAIGLVGLLIEMMIPGFGIFGLIGILCLGVFFWSHVLVGLAGWESIGFLIAGVIAVLLEVFAFTAVDFGLSGLIGLVLIGLGFYTAMLGPLSSSGQAGQAILIVVGGIFVSVIALVVLLTKLPKTRMRLGGMILSTAITGGAFTKNRETSIQSSWIGRRGLAATNLRPVGVGEFDGERVDVISEEGFLPKGTPISVIKDQGYRKSVRKDAA